MVVAEIVALSAGNAPSEGPHPAASHRQTNSCWGTLQRPGRLVPFPLVQVQLDEAPTLQELAVHLADCNDRLAALASPVPSCAPAQPTSLVLVNPMAGRWRVTLKPLLEALPRPLAHFRGLQLWGGNGAVWEAGWADVQLPRLMHACLPRVESLVLSHFAELHEEELLVLVAGLPRLRRIAIRHCSWSQARRQALLRALPPSATLSE